MRFFSDKRRRMSMVIVMIVAIFLSSGNLQMYTYADTAKTGVVVSPDGNLVETFSGASVSSAHVSWLDPGKELTILETTSGSDGTSWYKVSYVNKYNASIVTTAYIPAAYVLITSSTDSSDTQGGTAGMMAGGTINADNVYVRNLAGTSGSTRLTSLYRGDTVSIVGQTTVSGEIWYNVTCTKNGTYYNGWTCGRYIDITYNNVDTSSDYAQQLKNAGFPDSYIPNLTALHAKYPNWTFEAVNTGLDWNTVISKESTNGRNLVQTSADDAKKSTESGAYNWLTNTWTIYDSSSWVSAHPDYIAYCMDPRNFLDETNIFQFESLSYRSSQNLSGVQSILSGSFMSGSVKDTDGTTLNYAQAFVDIGKATGVSPYHLASRVRQEQGTGTSSLISGTYSGYTGYFNYFNVNAFGTSTTQVIVNGLAYAKNQGWNTRYKSLLGGAQLLSRNYIAVGQDTLYFQKFNVVNKNNLYGHQYMSNVTAAITEGQKLANGYSDKQQSFVFRIPVYSNMPAAAVKFTASGNPNNYLKSLSVSGLSLTPTFSGATTNYSIVVGAEISSVTVSAAAVAGTSTVSGTGTYSLAAGSNTIKINCTSKSGVTRTYTITVARMASGGSTGNVSITSSKYTIGSVVTGIAPGTSASAFLSDISVSGGTVKLLSASGSENTGTVGTGNRLAVYENGTLKAAYDVVVYGDMNGDGTIDILDMIRLNRHILGVSRLSGAYLQAADVNRMNDGADILDMIKLNRHILGLSTIQQ